jgi:uncharacterized protein
MKVLISEIPEEGLDVECKEPVESDTILSPISARLKIMKIGSELVVKGEVVADVKLQCSRCLVDFEHKLSVPVDVAYHPLEELKREERHEIMGGELDMDFYSGEEMDLMTLVKEQIVLHMPMKPLCTDLCKGICLTCGNNLNTGDCSCTEKEIDSRFVILKKMFDKDA